MCGRDRVTPSRASSSRAAMLAPLARVARRAMAARARRASPRRAGARARAGEATRGDDDARARVVVVGGGAAGVACARALAATRDVTLFDGGRALGGRASTRAGEGGAWEHGARFVDETRETAGDDDDGAEAWMRARAREGAFETWEGAVVALDGGRAVKKRVGARRCATPSFGAVAEALLEKVDARKRARVLGLDARDVDDAGVTVTYRSAAPGEGGETRSMSGFDVVVLADKNAANVADALGVEELARAMREVPSVPSLVLMVTLNRAPAIEFVGAEIENDDALSWISNESSKPSRRNDANCWVAHSTDAYARARVNLDTRPGTREHDAWMDAVANEMSESLLRILREAEANAAVDVDVAPLEITFARAHRWGAAFPAAVAVGAEKSKFLRATSTSPTGRVTTVYAVGDYCVEHDRFGGFRAAVASGLACAEDILLATKSARSKL